MNLGINMRVITILIILIFPLRDKPWIQLVVTMTFNKNFITLYKNYYSYSWRCYETVYNCWGNECYSTQILYVQPRSFKKYLR